MSADASCTSTSLSTQRQCGLRSRWSRRFRGTRPPALSCAIGIASMARPCGSASSTWGSQRSCLRPARRGRIRTSNASSGASVGISSSMSLCSTSGISGACSNRTWTIIIVFVRTYPWRWIVRSHAQSTLLSVGRWLPCPRSVVSITMMSDGRHESRAARLLGPSAPGTPGTPGTPEAGATHRGAPPRGVWSMSLTIILDDTLVAQLQVQAAARHLSVEALALQILSDAVVHEDDTAWRTGNQRRIALIRKQFAEGLSADEADELQQLQDMADQQVERFDVQRLDDVKQLYRQAKRLVDGASD